MDGILDAAASLRHTPCLDDLFDFSCVCVCACCVAAQPGSSSFPRFIHREWLALMPGVDPIDAKDDEERSPATCVPRAGAKKGPVRALPRCRWDCSDGCCLPQEYAQIGAEVDELAVKSEL